MSDHGEIVFPCPHLPQDVGAAKLVGLHQQRQEGLWMQRVKIPGGLLTAPQWRILGQIVKELTPDSPLHLTTRQDIELHDLKGDQVGPAQQMLATGALNCVGAGGDSLRNVMVCPCSGLLRGAVDLHPLAREIQRTVQAEEGIFSLPRKFKISLSCCRACGEPWINDLGFVIRRKDGAYGFVVIGAGSLGSKPATGIVLFDWLAAADVLPVSVAALRIFIAHGDREDRRRARFRHIRERMGDEDFLAALRETFKAVKTERAWPEVSLPKAVDGFAARMTLTFPNGDVAVAAAEALGGLAQRDDVSVRIGSDHRVIVFGRDARQLHEAVAAFGSLAEAAKPQGTIVACPGTRWCRRALVDTNRIADRIRAQLAGKFPPDLTVCISGCPNGCAHSAVAQIGLTGGTIMREGRREECFDLLVGGGMGRSDKLADLVARRLTADEVCCEMARRIPAARNSALLGKGA